MPVHETSWLRRTHLVIGLAGVAVFLGTGQYMDRVHDHLRAMDDVRRMLFRSAHIYILLSALLNLALGLYLEDARRGAARILQVIGSLLVASAPVLLLLAFAREPWLAELERPFARPALYGSLAGMLAHLVSRAVSRRIERAPASDAVRVESPTWR